MANTNYFVQETKAALTGLGFEVRAISSVFSKNQGHSPKPNKI